MKLLNWNWAKLSLVLLLVSGCATPRTEAEQEAYEYKLVEYQQSYRDTAEWCANQHERVLVHNYQCRSRRDCTPRSTTDFFGCEPIANWAFKDAHDNDNDEL